MLNSKLLLITNTIESEPMGGRQMLQKINYLILKEIFHNNLIVVELHKEKKNLIGYINSLGGKIDGINLKKIKEINYFIEKEEIQRVFIDGSNLGLLAKKIKKIKPKLKVSTFFHNIETVFFWGLFIYNKSIKSLLICIINYFAEKNSCRYSDELICLSKNDFNILKKMFKHNSHTHISPISLIDKYSKSEKINNQLYKKKYALFVGTNFYSNLEGISWFAKNVAEYINIDILVIGAGYEKLQKKLKNYKNIFFIGGVDNISEYYNSSDFVIAPIFSGSGMKTKVAEALMFGKQIIGTKQAFIGYENIISEAGYICEKPFEFINKISELSKKSINFTNDDLRSLYIKNYSYESALQRFKTIFNKD